MKKHIRNVIICGILLICAIISTAFIPSTDAKSIEYQKDESDISQCILEGETAIGEVGIVPLRIERENTLQRNENILLTENQKETLTGSLEKKLSACLTPNLAENYQKKHEEILATFINPPEKDDNRPNLSIGILSGILDFKLTDLSITENESIAGVTYVSYHIWLEKETDHKYLLTMTMSQYDNIYLLRDNGDGWHITETSQYNQYFAPDSFEHVKGTYETLDEALDAAEKIDPEAENPF